jgi:Uma2 family endonuclease
MASVQEITTAEQLLEAPDLGRCELVRGELMMMSPAGFEHGAVAGRIHGHLFVFVSQNRLGLVTAAETGFQIGHDPDTVRAPDAAFIRANRLPRMRTRGYFNGPPDLAVEVVSPNDRAGEVLTKVQDWLSAGCPTVWVADPTSQTVSVYHRSGETKLLTVAEELVDDDVLPGFRLSVAEIF